MNFQLFKFHYLTFTTRWTVFPFFIANAEKTKYQVYRGRDPPAVIIDDCVSLKTPQLFRVFLYSFKCVAEKHFAKNEPNRITRQYEKCVKFALNKC